MGELQLRNIQLPTQIGFNVPQIEDITDLLPKNPKRTWDQQYERRSVNMLTDIVVHHTGMAKAKGCTAESHARAHINSRQYDEIGEGGIPYHVYINTINVPRIQQVNDLLTHTHGVKNNNKVTVHIAVEGNFTVDAFTELDRMCLYAAILAVKAHMPNYKALKGHNEYVPTLCPAIDMNRVRNDIADLEERVLAPKIEDADTLIHNMFVRMKDLQQTLYNGGPYAPEAKRKLLVIHESIKEKGFYR